MRPPRTDITRAARRRSGGLAPLAVCGARRIWSRRAAGRVRGGTGPGTSASPCPKWGPPWRRDRHRPLGRPCQKLHSQRQGQNGS